MCQVFSRLRRSITLTPAPSRSTGRGSEGPGDIKVTVTTTKPVADAAAPPRPDRPALLRLYAQMVLLRKFELTVQDLYKNGKLPGFVHLYVGQEAVAVGVCAHLNADDWITSTHRGHGHALAKGLSPNALMAELYAKSTGCC